MSSINDKTKLITKVALILHKNGISTYEQEELLSKISCTLGLESSFLITPTSISFTLESGNESISKNLRSTALAIDLNKVNEVYRLTSLIVKNQSSLKESLKIIEEIENLPLLYRRSLQLLAYSIVSLCIVIFLGGSTIDLLLSFLLSAIGYLINQALRTNRFEHIRETIISFTVTLLACFMQLYINGINLSIVVISSLIILLPGLNLVSAISECANKYTGSGASRLIGTFVDFFKIGSGIIMAHYLMGLKFTNLNTLILSSYSGITLSLVVVLCSAATSIVFNSNKKDIFPTILISLATINLLQFLKLYINLNFSIFLTVMIISVTCTIYSTTKNKSQSTLLLPVLVMLVPGSVGSVGINLILENNLDLGLSEFSKAISIATAIVSGLFFSDVITFKQNLKR